MADTPTVSIVVPTFARPAELRRCLDGIARLEAATFSFEVVVVDDGGPEPLDTLVESGVARSRADALGWCVRLVGEHTDEWLGKLREAMSDVQRLRTEGPQV